ncbi:MAG: transposase [Planctomycetales bacterium]|nr:transposase [Planctomycetales bacterium]
MLLTFVWWPSLRRFRTASMTDPKSQLTDEQWNLITDVFPWEPPTRAGGRPRVPSRPCLEGILWILRTGARWKDLPKHFPSPATCWRRLKAWTEAGLFQKAWARVLRRLEGRGRIDWEQALADGTFVPAKKGVCAWARPSVAKGPRSCSWSMATGRRWGRRSPAPRPPRSH